MNLMKFCFYIIIIALMILYALDMLTTLDRIIFVSGYTFCATWIACYALDVYKKNKRYGILLMIAAIFVLIGAW